MPKGVEVAALIDISTPSVDIGVSSTVEEQLDVGFKTVRCHGNQGSAMLVATVIVQVSAKQHI